MKLETICREMYSFKDKLKPRTKGRTVPWWTDELQVMRKRTKTLRRRYRGATTNEILGESRRRQYNKADADYQTAIQIEKARSLKEYCTLTPANPWKQIIK